MSRSFKRVSVLAASALLSTMVWQSAASAAPGTTCTGNLNGGTYKSIEVPAGATCNLDGVTVTGNVLARDNSKLDMVRSSAKQVHGQKAEIVHVRSSNIGGNVHINHGKENNPGFDIIVRNSTVKGNIHLHHNAGSIEVRNNTVAGHIQIQHNASHIEVTLNRVAKNLQVMKTTTSGTKIVRANSVDGQIHCNDNSSPFTGGPNNSAKKVHGQCFVA